MTLLLDVCLGPRNTDYILEMIMSTTRIKYTNKNIHKLHKLS